MNLEGQLNKAKKITEMTNSLNQEIEELKKINEDKVKRLSYWETTQLEIFNYHQQVTNLIDGIIEHGSNILDRKTQ